MLYTVVIVVVSVTFICLRLLLLKWTCGKFFFCLLSKETKDEMGESFGFGEPQPKILHPNWPQLTHFQIRISTTVITSLQNSPIHSNHTSKPSCFPYNFQKTRYSSSSLHNFQKPFMFSYFLHTQMLHAWNIYVHVPHKWPSFAGKYSIHGAYGIHFAP